MALNYVSPVARELNESALAFPSADGVNAVELAAGVAAEITIPASAGIVRLVGTADFYLKANDTAAVPGDVADGTASELMRFSDGERWRSLSGVTSLSVISEVDCLVTASFYKI